MLISIVFLCNSIVYSEGTEQCSIYVYNSDNILTSEVKVDKGSVYNLTSNEEKAYTYKYYYYNVETQEKILIEETTITINSDTTILYEKNPLIIRKIVYEYDVINNQAYDSFTNDYVMAPIVVEPINGYICKKYDPTTKTYGEIIESGTEFYENLTYIQIPEITINLYVDSALYKTIKIDPTNIVADFNYDQLEATNRFLGWSYSSFNFEKVDTSNLDFKKIKNKELNLYAKIEKICTFIVNFPNYIESSSGLIETQTYENATFYELLNGYYLNETDYFEGFLNFAPHGKTFDLYQNDICILKQNKIENEIDYSNNEIVLKLIEEYKDYYISYNLNGGSFSAEYTKVTKYTMDTEDITIAVPNRKGYDFDYWLVNDLDKVNSTYIITKGSSGNYSFIANWIPKNFTITYINEYSDEVYEDYAVAYNSILSDINKYTPERTGYNFLGWSTEKNNPKKILYPTSFYIFDQNAIVYPIFEAKEYTISFQTNFVDVNVDSIQVLYDSKINLTAPVVRGYTFKGWYYGDVEIKSLDIYTYDSDIILSAKWQAKQYNVKVFISENLEEQTFIATYDQSLNLINDYIEQNTNNIIGFYRNEINKNTYMVGRNGIIDKWNIDEDIKLVVYTVDITEFSNQAPLYKTKLPENWNILVDDTIIIEDCNYDEIGNHKIVYSDGENNIYEFDFVVKADLPISSDIIYESPISFKKIKAKVYLDGKEITAKDNTYRLDYNGTHTIKIVGTNGYEVEYTYTYKNNNIFYSWFILGISIILLVGAIVLVIFGRKKVLINGND